MLRDRLLGNVFTKTIRDWLLWTVIAVVALWAMALMYVGIMGIAGDEYMTLMEDMPEALTNIYGQHDGTAAGLAMSGIFSVMGPLVLLAYAIGLGSSAAVGEEEARTLPILLSSPLRRRSVLLAKTSVAVLGLVIIIDLTWLGVEVFGGHLRHGPRPTRTSSETSVQLLGMVLPLRRARRWASAPGAGLVRAGHRRRGGPRGALVLHHHACCRWSRSSRMWPGSRPGTSSAAPSP